jgi:ATP-dependent Lon protease
VLPIGGLKEKLTAAARAGVTTVLVPARNKSDLVDLPDEVLRLLDIRQVDTIDEVLEIALLAPDERTRLSGGVRVSPTQTQPEART